MAGKWAGLARMVMDFKLEVKLHIVVMLPGKQLSFYMFCVCVMLTVVWLLSGTTASTVP
jgi:hypothetical protein